MQLEDHPLYPRMSGMSRSAAIRLRGIDRRRWVGQRRPLR